jgi:hypothetical protein
MPVPLEKLKEGKLQSGKGMLFNTKNALILQSTMKTIRFLFKPKDAVLLSLSFQK